MLALFGFISVLLYFGLVICIAGIYEKHSITPSLFAFIMLLTPILHIFTYIRYSDEWFGYKRFKNEMKK